MTHNSKGHIWNFSAHHRLGQFVLHDHGFPPGALQVLVLRLEDDLGDVELEGGRDGRAAAAAVGPGHPRVVADARLAVWAVQLARQRLLHLGAHPGDRVQEDRLRAQVEAQVGRALEDLQEWVNSKNYLGW